MSRVRPRIGVVLPRAAPSPISRAEKRRQWESPPSTPPRATPTPKPTREPPTPPTPPTNTGDADGTGETGRDTTNAQEPEVQQWVKSLESEDECTPQMRLQTFVHSRPLSDHQTRTSTRPTSTGRRVITIQKDIATMHSSRSTGENRSARTGRQKHTSEICTTPSSAGWTTHTATKSTSTCTGRQKIASEKSTAPSRTGWNLAVKTGALLCTGQRLQRGIRRNATRKCLRDNTQTFGKHTARLRMMTQSRRAGPRQSSSMHTPRIPHTATTNVTQDSPQNQGPPSMPRVTS